MSVSPNSRVPQMVRPERWAVLSTFPPTQCGIATFSQALVTALARQGIAADVVRLTDAPSSPDSPAVVHQLLEGAAGAELAAAQVLNRYDLVIVQHEYGIYGGPDGERLLTVLAALKAPVLSVLHTVLSAPTARQRAVLQAVLDASQLLVTMTATARQRLIEGYVVDPASVLVIPHGAADALLNPIPQRSEPAGAVPGRPMVLTWGLLGAGKGIEWAIEAMAALRDLVPRPLYMVAGRTHPRVLQREGERYRHGLQAQAQALGVVPDVVFEDGYLSASTLHRLIHRADVVLLPYDSPEQVTSGVLIEAVAAGRPVVSTRFPHAVELLAGGAGVLVDQQDPAAIADALRGVLTEPGTAAGMSARARGLAPSLSWHAVAGRYLAAGSRLRAGRPSATPVRSAKAMT